MKEDDDFYLLEETIEIIRRIEGALLLNKLDPDKDINLHDRNEKDKVVSLIQNLDVLVSRKEKDPRMLKLVVDVRGLKEFLVLLKSALEGRNEKWVQTQKTDTLRRANSRINFIVAELEKWAKIAEEKVHSHQPTTHPPNYYLNNLPQPDDGNFFYIFVRELNSKQARYLHPFDERQLENQKSRSTDDLLKFDSTDPISGNRIWMPGDSDVFPASGVLITQGHHRTFELYKRFINGEISGNTLLLVKKDYARR